MEKSRLWYFGFSLKCDFPFHFVTLHPYQACGGRTGRAWVLTGETPKIDVIKIWQTFTWPTVFICAMAVSVLGLWIGASSSEAQGSLQMSVDDLCLPKRKAGPVGSPKLGNRKEHLGALIADHLLTCLEVSRHFCISHHWSAALGEREVFLLCCLKRYAEMHHLGKQRVVCFADLSKQKKGAVSGCSG